MNLENMLVMPSLSEDWHVWLIIGGRGLGKTTSAAFHISQMLKNGDIKNIALIGRGMSDVINTMLYNGIMKFMPDCQIDSRRKVIKDSQGDVVGYYFSQINSYKIRGFSFDFAWIDEMSTFNRENIHDLWRNLLMCLRIGISRIIITTTPGSLDLIKTIISEYKTYVTTGTSYDNANLSSTFMHHISHMDHDEFYNQEVIGLMSNNYELWAPGDIVYRELPKCDVILYNIGIDPAVSHGVTGIVLSAICYDKAYVLGDYSVAAPIKEWIKIVYNLSIMYDNVQIILEINQGGQALKDILQMSGITCPILTQYARESKYQRNLKSYSLYESKSVFHACKMEHLEKEMLYKPKDRVDALTWSLMPVHHTNITKFLFI